MTNAKADFLKWERAFQDKRPRSFWRSLGQNCDLDRLTFFLFHIFREEGAKAFEDLAGRKRLATQAQEALSSASKQFKRTIRAAAMLRPFVGGSWKVENLKKALARRMPIAPNVALPTQMGSIAPQPALSLEGLIQELRDWDAFSQRLILDTTPMATKFRGKRLRLDKRKIVSAACEIRKCVCDPNRDRLDFLISEVLNAALDSHGLKCVSEGSVRLNLRRYLREGDAYSAKSVRQ